MTYKEVIRKTIEEGYIGVDNTCNGKCSKCGECCGSVLPLGQEDADKMQEYIFKHNITTTKHILVMSNTLKCPYYTGKSEKGCSIYEARPKICRFYKCDLRGMSLEEFKKMKEAIPIDMWAFAKAVEKEMKKHGINKETRKKVNQSI